MGFPAARRLGQTDLSVGPIGLKSTFGRVVDDVRWAFDAGCTYLVLGPRRGRPFARALRQIVKRQRDELVLGWESQAASPLALRLRLELLLRRLGTDRVDVLVLGDAQLGRADEFLAQAERLRGAGKVRAVALAHRHENGARAAARVGPPFDVVQTKLHAAAPALPSWQGPVAPAYVAHSATAHGALLRTAGVGLSHFATVADCYRFVLSHPQVSVCLAGAPARSDLRAALSALTSGPMSDDELMRMRWIGGQLLRTRAAHVTHEGERLIAPAASGFSVGRAR